MVGWAEMPRSPGHVFYDAVGADGEASTLPELPALLHGQDGRALGAARALFPHAVGEGSKRGLEWRCSDSLSLRESCDPERVPDHSWLSKTP